MSADEALGQRSDAHKENAEEWLLTTLALGAMESGKLIELAAAEGIKERTLWRAKKELNVKARAIGGKQWEWCLPAECLQDG